MRRMVQPVRGAPIHINVGPCLARQVLWVLPPARIHQSCATGFMGMRAK